MPPARGDERHSVRPQGRPRSGQKPKAGFLSLQLVLVASWLLACTPVLAVGARNATRISTGQELADAVAAWGRLGRDVTLQLTQPVISIRNATIHNVTAVPGQFPAPFTRGKLTIIGFGGVDGACTVLDMGMRTGLIPRLSNVARLHLEGVCILNSCEQQTSYGAVSSLGSAFGHAFAYQSTAMVNTTIYARAADVNTHAYFIVMQRVRFQQVRALTAHLHVDQTDGNIAISAIMPHWTLAASYSHPSLLAKFLKLASTSDPRDRILQQLRDQGLVMEPQYCNGTLMLEDVAHKPVDEALGPVWIVEDASGFVQALEQVANRTEHKSDALYLPPVMHVHGVVDLATVAEPHLAAQSHVVVSGPFNDVPEYAHDTFLGLGQTTAGVVLAPGAQLFLMNMEIHGLASQPLPRLPSTAPVNVSTLAPVNAAAPSVNSTLGFAWAQRMLGDEEGPYEWMVTPHVWLHNVTLSLPVRDYLALAELAFDSAAVGRAISKEHLARAAEVARGVTGIQLLNYGGNCEWFTLTNYVGWGVNATMLRVEPEGAPQEALCTVGGVEEQPPAPPPSMQTLGLALGLGLGAAALAVIVLIIIRPVQPDAVLPGWMQRRKGSQPDGKLSHASQALPARGCLNVVWGTVSPPSAGSVSTDEPARHGSWRASGAPGLPGGASPLTSHSSECQTSSDGGGSGSHMSCTASGQGAGSGQSPVPSSLLLLTVSGAEQQHASDLGAGSHLGSGSHVVSGQTIAQSHGLTRASARVPTLIERCSASALATTSLVGSTGTTGLRPLTPLQSSEVHTLGGAGAREAPSGLYGTLGEGAAGAGAEIDAGSYDRGPRRSSTSSHPRSSHTRGSNATGPWSGSYPTSSAWTSSTHPGSGHHQGGLSQGGSAEPSSEASSGGRPPAGPPPSAVQEPQQGGGTDARRPDRGPSEGGVLLSVGAVGNDPPTAALAQLGIDPAARVKHVASVLNEHANKVVITGVLGNGTWGTVYKGVWRGLPVALKTFVFQSSALDSPPQPSQPADAPGADGQPAGGAEKTDQQVAARPPADESSFPRRFDQAIMEAAIAASVGHRNVVATYYYDIKPIATHDTGGAQGGLCITQADDVTGNASHPTALDKAGGSRGATEFKLFLVQELCGVSLATALRAGTLHDSNTGITAQTEVLSILLDISRGLEYLHGKGIIHGDLKPANVLLSVDGQSPVGVVAKLADFGLSTCIEAGATHVSNYNSGTPFYVAPEVVNHFRASPASDIYSFGVLMWQLYTGQTPFLALPGGGFSWNPAFPHFMAITAADGTPVLPPINFIELCHWCMGMQPRERPTAAQVVSQLSLMWPAGLPPPGGATDGAVARCALTHLA